MSLLRFFNCIEYDTKYNQTLIAYECKLCKEVLHFQFAGISSIGEPSIFEQNENRARKHLEIHEWENRLGVKVS